TARTLGSVARRDLPDRLLARTGAARPGRLATDPVCPLVSGPVSGDGKLPRPGTRPPRADVRLHGTGVGKPLPPNPPPRSGEGGARQPLPPRTRSRGYPQPRRREGESVLLPLTVSGRGHRRGVERRRLAGFRGWSAAGT